MKVLLTGFTGNLGAEIARQLAPHEVFALVRDPAVAPQTANVTLVQGSLEHLPLKIVPELEAIVHSAAATAFRRPLAELRSVNVDGTARLLEFARLSPRLRRFIHLSTTCVCGDRAGLTPEAPLPEPLHFINGYERSKWEAEQVVLASGLPVEIVRLATVAGSERDGSVRRLGALHHMLFWLYKGLIPMMPGAPETSVDLISTELAAAAVAGLLNIDLSPGRILHASAGEHAAKLGELLEFLSSLFAKHHRGWATGAIASPDIVDATTFALFEATARHSGDLLFQRVFDDAQSFIPSLTYSRTMATSLVSQFPVPDWRALTQQVFAWLLASNWGRSPSQATPVCL